MAWPDNSAPRGIPCGPISSRVCKPHLMIPPVFSRVQVLGVDEHMWHCQDRRRRDPRELTGIMTLTRGKDHPTARLSGPGSRKIWHRVQELARRAWRRLPLRYPDRDTRPPPRGGRQQQRYRLDYSKDATSVLDAFHIVKLAGDAPGEVRRRVQQDTLGHRGRKGAPSTWSAIFCAPHTRRLTPAPTRTPP